MALHVIVGAGPVGSAVARELLDRGERVRVVTRSGSGIDGTEKLSADASDPQRLSELAAGAGAIYNCVNPPYHRWARDWPPVANALLAAAESSGAVLATTGNLYVYGRVDRPMTEDMPAAATGTKGRIRARMTQDALDAHRAGQVRAFEVRGSDYLGGNSLLSMLVTPALRKGRTAFVPADLDAPHTWTNVVDVAKLLVVGASDERAWGEVWHVPSAPPCSIRELTTMAAAELGAKPKLVAVPYPVIWTVGLFNATIRELRETQHQFRKPFVLDSSRAQQTFGLEPAPLEESVRLDIAATPA
ncbi:MAG: NAD-dependent epimerase/dehydratase family protein [Pseudonocardiales bacterium]|nr:NAD-dependent epimerase/dehydratase family protein [Pseudonocardiales bacterium]